MVKVQQNRPRFVCGIDFGTTFTSVAFAHSSSPDEVKLVQKWPNGGVSSSFQVDDRSAEDVPTQVLYLSSNSKQVSRKQLWGFQIPQHSKDSVEVLRWFKLLLEDRAVTHRSSQMLVEPNLTLASQPYTPLERTAQKIKSLDLEPVDVVSDFLRNIREEALKSMSETYDKSFVAQSKAILLVGGFGSSPYLKHKLETITSGGNGIQVIQPVNARTAIKQLMRYPKARGALIRGLDGSMVSEKRCRRFYGYEAIAPYELGKGLESRRYWNSAQDMYYVSGKMMWYLKKEAVVGDKDSATFTLCRHVSVEGYRPSLLVFEDSLMACDKDVAPEYRWEDQAAVYKICTLRSDLSNVPINRFERIVNNAGKEFHRVSFDLKLSIIGDVMQFGLVFQGKECGNVTAKFE